MEAKKLARISDDFSVVGLSMVAVSFLIHTGVFRTPGDFLVLAFMSFVFSLGFLILSAKKRTHGRTSVRVSASEIDPSLD